MVAHNIKVHAFSTYGVGDPDIYPRSGSTHNHRRPKSFCALSPPLQLLRIRSFHRGCAPLPSIRLCCRLSGNSRLGYAEPCSTSCKLFRVLPRDQRADTTGIRNETHVGCSSSNLRGAGTLCRRRHCRLCGLDQRKAKSRCSGF